MSKISQYPPASTLDGTELVPVVQEGVTVQATVADIANAGGVTAPVDSVNGQTGAVVLDAADVGADPAGTAAALVSVHNAAGAAHGGVQASFAAHAGAGGTTHPLATALARGFMPALPTDATKFLDGDGNWSVPTGGVGNLLSTLTSAQITGTITTATTLTGADLGKIFAVSDDSPANDYAVTLPTAVGNDGAIIGFRVKKYALASRQFYITPATGESIDGRAANAALILVHTNVLVLMSDGVGWVSLVKKVDTDWIDGGSVTPSATTTAPTKGTTTVDRMLWRRQGDSAEFRYEYRQSSGGSDGSGVYLIPFIFTADTAKITVGTWTTVNEPWNCCGNGNLNGWTATASLYDSTRVAAMVEREGSQHFWSSDYGDWAGVACFQLRFTVPIVNW